MVQAMQTDGAEGWPLRDPASVLLPGMHLLAQLTSAEPGLALSLVQMQVPSGGEGDADLLALAAGGLSLQRAAAGLSDAEALQLYSELPLMACKAQLPELSCVHYCLCSSFPARTTAELICTAFA